MHAPMIASFFTVSMQTREHVLNVGPFTIDRIYREIPSQ